MTPLARFFIIIPVHNGGEYLPLAVQSVLDQTRSNWHLVILENGSDDGTAQWLQTLRDERISVYAVEQTLSIEANWKRILDVPCGEFVTLLGHDDLLDPWYLEEMQQLISEQPDAALYQTQFRLIDAAGNTLRAASPQPEHEGAAEFLQARLQRQRESFGTGYLMRRQDYIRVGGIPSYPGLLFADDALWIQLMQISFKATSLRECFAYRVHLKSSSAVSSWDIHLDAMQGYTMLLKELATQDEDIRRTYTQDQVYFIWHTHQAYAIALTQATRNNLRIETATTDRFNTLLTSIQPSWDLKHHRSRGLRLREAINRFAFSRKLYNFIQHLRYGS